MQWHEPHRRFKDSSESEVSYFFRSKYCTENFGDNIGNSFTSLDIQLDRSSSPNLSF